MKTADWAFVISILSLVVALVSLIWNVWSKFIYPKPRLRVSFGIVNPVEHGRILEPFLRLITVNHGPSETTVEFAITRERSRLLRWRYSVLKPLDPKQHHFGVFSGVLPKELPVGKSLSVYFPFDHEDLKARPISDVGFKDVFGRRYWARRAEVKEVLRQARTGENPRTPVTEQPA